ncbi:MAG: response regulator [Elusimicrobia bacterium]|nr:response regulator [Elusimicrobiota bacterium]
MIPKRSGRPKARILVVDDQPEIIAAFGLFFSERNWEVRGAGSVKEALAALEKETFDVIFLDFVLPGTTGLQALPGLARASAAPILMMTGHFDPELKTDALLMGALDCLAKPMNFAELEARVLKIVGA